MGENDIRAMPSAPATPEPSPAVSALRGGIGIAVTQADRRAAAPHMGFAYQRAIDGECDEGTLVEDFARHRTEAQAKLREAGQRLISVFDQQRMTAAERIIVGVSDAGLRTEGNAAIEALRIALASGDRELEA